MCSIGVNGDGDALRADRGHVWRLPVGVASAGPKWSTVIFIFLSHNWDSEIFSIFGLDHHECKKLVARIFRPSPNLKFELSISRIESPGTLFVPQHLVFLAAWA